ncbi:hypothetical protein GCM10023198_32040 [Promicromonospora umidemergens]|uniref:HTH cro/C1-type domain-containing protein n=1 Tax=Promicromonospora umidemergens TaxID=629679 RepID=A0ABP8XFT5_9MICO
MARVSKPLQPLDHEVQRILAEAVRARALSLRTIGDLAGMSANRAGIILRCEEPPATLGELDGIARQVGMTASRLVALGEASLTASTASADEPDDPVPSVAPQSTTARQSGTAAGAGLPLGGPRPRRTQPSSGTRPRKHTK